MTEPEQFLADLREALERAASEAKQGLNPTAAATHALRWLQHECHRGRGIEPGWGGRNVYLRRGKDGMLERHRQVREMGARGIPPAAIAVTVNYGEAYVRHILCERREK